MRKYRYTPLIIVLALILAVVSYAFAAENTVPDSVAGEGDGDITGVTVADIHYTLDTSNPSQMTAVSFTVTPALNDPTTATVRASIFLDDDPADATAGAWSAWSDDCTLAAGTWTCTFGTALSVHDAINLRVVTAD